MENIDLGAFIAQLRKEAGMTQKELADRIHVTDKAVSKWETGKGFPDIKLLDPLSRALGVSLAELVQGERIPRGTLSMDEADAVISKAMDRSQMAVRRYLKLLRWMLAAITVSLSLACLIAISWSTSIPTAAIGGADGPTTILIATSSSPFWVFPTLFAAAAAVCLTIAVRVWMLEKKLK